MNARAKIAIDRLIALPLAWLLNGAARVLGRLLRRDHRITESNVRTVVIAKYLGMGSIIQATPLIRSIRAAFPEARLVFVTGRGCRRLLERLEHVDEVIEIDDRGPIRAAWTSLRALGRLVRRRVDLYFDLELYSSYASIMALLSLARNRIGFYRESAEHKRGNYTHLMYFNPRSPIRYTYLQLGRLVGCEPVEPDRLGTIRIDERDRREAAVKLSAVGAGPGDYLVINPNASDLMVERRWPADRFAELIGRLAVDEGLPVVLIGAPAERPYVDALTAQVGDGRVLNLAGELSLGGLFALLEGARCVVTNDTGPMHMAWALGAPTVALFGPVDPSQYGWVAPGVRILYKSVYCSPCVHEIDRPPCRGHNVCMQRIPVVEALEAVDRVLYDPTEPAPGGAIDPFFFVEQDAGPLGCVVRASPETWTRTATTRPPAPPAEAPGTPFEVTGNSRATS